MTTTADYLARLDDALRDVPHGIAADIRNGIAEELQSFAPDAAAARIAQLGDPAVIAREAMDAGGYAAAAAPVPVRPAPALPVPVTRSRGFAITAALVLSFGGFAVPVAGWVVGIVLVILSTMWRTWEKVVAILAPLVLFGLVLAASIPAWRWVGNVLTPTFGVHSMMIICIVVVVPASGLWLLWRMHGRTAA